MRIPHSTANNQVLLSSEQTQQAVQNATGNSMASLAKPAGAYHVSHMEFTATGNKAAGSEATRFPHHHAMAELALSMAQSTLNV